MQRIEPLLPQTPISVEPLIEFCQRRRAKGVDPPLCLLVNLDKPRFP